MNILYMNINYITNYITKNTLNCQINLIFIQGDVTEYVLHIYKACREYKG